MAVVEWCRIGRDGIQRMGGITRSMEESNFRAGDSGQSVRHPQSRHADTLNDRRGEGPGASDAITTRPSWTSPLILSRHLSPPFLDPALEVLAIGVGHLLQEALAFRRRAER